MLERGIIVESKSEWKRPVVLVPKTDGLVQFCIDFRQFNSISKFDAYPMPKIDELLQQLRPAKYLSTIDLTKGLLADPFIPIFARKKKSFSSLPLGIFSTSLCLSASMELLSFQQLMNRILSPHLEYAVANIDSIIFCSLTWRDHLQHLKVESKRPPRHRSYSQPHKM